MKRNKFRYPVYKKNMANGCIVKFTGLREGVVVKDTEKSKKINQRVGFFSESWVEHTYSNAWEDYVYDDETLELIGGGYEYAKNVAFDSQISDFIEDKREDNMIVTMEDIQDFIDNFTFTEKSEWCIDQYNEYIIEYNIPQ